LTKKINAKLTKIVRINGARGWEFHPASMTLQAIACSRPP